MSEKKITDILNAAAPAVAHQAGSDFRSGDTHGKTAGPASGDGAGSDAVGVADDSARQGAVSLEGRSSTVGEDLFAGAGAGAGAGRPSEIRAIEAVLMVAEEPVQPHLLAELLEISSERVEELCADLASDLQSEGRGFVLVKVAGGFRFQSHSDMADFVERFAIEGQSSRLTTAALETLAIVAYKQPISRAQVSQIRGVNVDSTMGMLNQRGYIEEVGRDPGIGRAILYGTTLLFLEKLGLGSVSDLPPLADFVPGPEVVEKLEAGLRPLSD